MAGVLLVQMGRSLAEAHAVEDLAKDAAETAARRPRSDCTACAYLIKPIAAENCGFSKAAR
jgi:hypothetical protein